MLEQRIQELTAAVVELIATIKGGATIAPKSETPATETPAKQEKAPKPKEEKPAKEEKKSSGPSAELKPIQEKGMALIKSGKQEQVKAVLKAVGAATFTAIKPENYAAVMAELTKLESATEDAATPAEEPKKEPAVKLDDVLPLAKKIVEKGKDSDEVKALQAALKKVGADKVSTCPAEKLGTLLEEIKKILAPKADESLV